MMLCNVKHVFAPSSARRAQTYHCPDVPEPKAQVACSAYEHEGSKV